MSRLITPGEPAPDFEVQDSNGITARLSGYRDNRIVVLYFLRGFM
jgi:peroxiredoxin